MRQLAMLAVVAALFSPTVASGQDYSFGDWARDQGYSPGDVMPQDVWTGPAGIESLDGIGEFDWATTPTTFLDLNHNPISSVESGDFDGLTNLSNLVLSGTHISSIESDDFNGLTNLVVLQLYENQISSIESGALSGLTKLRGLYLNGNMALTDLNLAEAEFSNLWIFDVKDNVNVSSVSLRNAMVNQTALTALMDGGANSWTGIGELNGITDLDLSGIDFADVNDLKPLYVMDDLTDLWLVNTQNVDATALDVLLDNLATIEGADTEGILYMTQADYDAFNVAGGGLLADWNDEQGHHVQFVIPEPSTLLLSILALCVVAGWRKRGGWPQRRCQAGAAAAPHDAPEASVRASRVSVSSALPARQRPAGGVLDGLVSICHLGGTDSAC
jgi:hypothetical protein